MLKKSQIKFFLYFLAIFVALFSLLYSAGWVPASLKKDSGESLRVLWDKAKQQSVINQNGTENISGEQPIRIIIPKIGVDATVANPNTTNTATLDNYLTEGAVRYPGSGLIGFGNMFIFGHSTGLAVVRNQAYKTFNGLKNLQVGDIINVYSVTKIYEYRVATVRLAEASEVLVQFDSTRNMLTLSTCNTFGGKSERYVVEAF